MSVLIALFTTILLLLSAFVVLVILMQKPSANAGMGSALGGGAAEQAFGGEAANVLTRTTIFSIIGFFVLAFGLYMANLVVYHQPEQANDNQELMSLATSMEEEAPVEETETPVVAPAADDASAIDLDTILDESTPAAEETPLATEEAPAPVPAE